MLPPPPKDLGKTTLPPPPENLGELMPDLFSKKKEGTELSSIELPAGSPAGGSVPPSTGLEFGIMMPGSVEPNRSIKPPVTKGTGGSYASSGMIPGTAPKPSIIADPITIEEQKKLVAQKKKEEYFAGLASRYLEQTPNLAEYTPLQLQKLKEKASLLGIEPSYIDDAINGVKSVQNLKKSEELVAERTKTVEQDLKTGKGEFDVLGTGPFAKTAGTAPIEVTPEIVKAKLEKDAEYYAKQQFPQYDELFKISADIKNLQAQEKLTADQQVQLKNLLDNYYSISETEMLFDPKTGQLVDEPNEDTKKYQSDVFSLSQGYQQTPMDKMRQLFLQKKEMLQLRENEYFKNSGKGFTQQQLYAMGMNPDAFAVSDIKPEGGLFYISPEQALALDIEADDLNVYKKNYIDAKKDFDAIIQAYLLNLDPGKTDMGNLSYFESGIREGLSNSPIIGGIADLAGFDPTKMTDVQRLEIYANNASQAKINLTEKQQKEVEQDLGETVIRATGNSLPIMGDIGIFAAISKGAGGATGLTGAFKSMVDAATNKYGKIVGGALDIIGAGLVTAAEFEMASAGGATGAGEGTAQGILDKVGVLDKITGKYNVLLKALVKTGAGGLGETFGEYAGEFANALEKNGFDYNKVIDDTFGKDLDEATKKGLATLITSLLFSGASNTGALVAGREWLNNQDVPNKDELLADIDKKIAEDEAAPAEQPPAEVAPAEVVPTPTEEIQSRVAVITTQEDAKKLAEDVMFSDLPKEEKQALLNDILTKQEEILQNQPVAEEGPVDIPAPIVEEVAPVEVAPIAEETVVETPIAETAVVETAPVVEPIPAVEPTPTKEPIKIGQKLEYRDTETGPRLMNRETGKPADLGSVRKYEGEVIDKLGETWDQGKRVEEETNRTAYVSDVLENSENPFQIATAFLESEELPFALDYQSEAIADALGGAMIDRQSFIDAADVNLLEDVKEYSFGDNLGTENQLDVIAIEVTSVSGVETSVGDIVKFMQNNPSIKEFRAQSKNPFSRKIQQKFKALTGIALNKDTAIKMQDKEFRLLAAREADIEASYNQSEATNYESQRQEFEDYLDSNPDYAAEFYGEAGPTNVDSQPNQNNEGTEGEGAEEVNIAEQAKSLADNIRKLRIDTKGTAGINIAPAVWNAAVDIVADIVENGGKIADAVSKGVKYIKETEAYKKATVADKKILEAQFKEAFGMFEDVKIPKNTKKTIEASTGVTKERTKVVVDEMTELKRQIRAEARAAAQGFRQGVSDTKKAGKEFAAKIAEAIKPLGSKLNPSQIKALVGRAGEVSTERQLEKFQEYAEKVITDASYADNLAAVAKAIKQLKRNVKDRNSIKIKEIGRLDLSQLTPQQISELNDVLVAANQRVPDTSLLEAYDVPVTQKIPRQAKSMDDYMEYRDEILSTPIYDLDDVRKAVRKINTARRMLDAMLSQGMITEPEYEDEVKILDDMQNLQSSMFKQDVDNAKRLAVGNILINLRNNWDKEDFTPEENDFIGKLKSLTGDEMFDLNIGDLDALSDVSDRIANGTIPLNIATSIYGRAIGKTRGLKVAEQINEGVAKGIIPGDGAIKEGGGTAKRLDRAEAQSVEDILNLGRGKAIYSYLYNVFARATTAIKRSNDALFKRYKDVAGEAGFGEKVFGKLGIKQPAAMKKRTLQKAKVMMNRYASMARNTKGSIYGFEISSIDYFGLLLGNEAAYDALVPTDGNKDVEAAKQQIRDRIEEQVTAYDTKRDGKINGVSQLDIMREVYNSFPKNADGTVDWESIRLTAQEQKIADVVNEILEELRNKQRFANEAKGIPFEEQFDYLPTNWIQKDSDFTSQESQGKAGTRAGSSYVRTDFRPGAMSINLDQLIAKAITDTNEDYYFTNADMEMKPTLAYAGEGITSKPAKALVKNTLKQDLAARRDFYNSKFSVAPWLRRFMNAGYIAALVNPVNRVIDTAVSTIKIPQLLGTPKALKAVFSPIQRKAFAKLIEMTDSSLGAKLSKWKDPSFSGERSDPNLFQRLTDGIISVDETINMVGAWMPSFTMEFASLSGEEFDMNKFVSDPEYAEEFRREIEDAASYADREAKKIYGGGSKFEQRRTIQVAPVFRGLKADSYPGVFASYMGSFGYRERVMLWQALRDVVLARNQNRPIAALRAFGIVNATVQYGMVTLIAYATKAILFGDDEEKKKGQKMLDELLTPEGMLKESAASIGLLGLSKYGQAGRSMSTLSLSILYANSKDKETKKAIEGFMRENLYNKPIPMNKTGVQVAAAELVPPLTATLNNVFKLVYGGGGYGKNNPDAVAEIYEKYEKGGINALTKTEKDKWALITLTYNMMTLVGSGFGYAPPFKADLDRAIKGQLKEAKK